MLFVILFYGLVLVSMGKYGVMWVGPKGVLGKEADAIIDDNVAVKLVPAIPIAAEKIVNTSGAGDSFCAGLICGLMPGLGAGPSVDAIRWGLQCANKSLAVAATIAPNLSALDEL